MFSFVSGVVVTIDESTYDSLLALVIPPPVPAIHSLLLGAFDGRGVVLPPLLEAGLAPPLVALALAGKVGGILNLLAPSALSYAWLACAYHA